MGHELEQFYAIFFEEASELLVDMETHLLELNIESPDLEELNAIFRAAHSIKGGAGAFGFTDMTETTHMLESLLDKLRKGEMAVNSQMIDVFLQSGDLLKRQLGGHRGDEGVNTDDVDGVVSKLKEFMNNPGNAPSAVPTEPEAQIEIPTVVEAVVNESVVAEPDEACTEAKPAKPTYRIQFACGEIKPNLMEKLLVDLAQQGQLNNLSTAEQPDCCVLQLSTDISEEDIWEALAFIVDPAQLVIEKQAAAIAIPQALIVATAEVTLAPQPEQIAQPIPQAEIETPLAPPPALIPDSRTQLAPPQPQIPDPAPKKAAAAEPKEAVAQKEAPKAASNSESSSIRVSIEKVDQMINLVGELVITQAMLAQIASQVDPILYATLLNGMTQLERNTRDLQEVVMSIRMMPISFVFSRFPRIVRDLAGKLGKQIELKTVGEGTELDKGLIEKITDPLTHLIRNSLDHGIELPEKRIAAGKPAKGTITLRAFHQGGSIVIEVADDGAGLNREKILAKAQERGLPVHDGMADQEVWMLIFEAGFSTAEVVTDVSGRGVGMDVVKRNIQTLGGRIEIESVQGKGTQISIRLPLTLAILDGLSVAVGDQTFIAPLNFITESLKPVAADIKTVRGSRQVVHVRGEYLPIIALHEVFGLQPSCTEIHQGILIILEAEGKKVAMFVDSLLGQHQVVIKSLENNYRRVKGISGATIMGDGRVALILDPAGLVNTIKQEMVNAA